MTLNFLLKGLVVGFFIAAPVGPIGVLCIRRTLAEGRWIGLATGLGAATADSIYGRIAAFGLTAISSALVRQVIWLRLGGGIFLCYLGIRTFKTRPAQDLAEECRRGWSGAYLSTLLLTLTNPMTILSFVGVFAGFGLAAARNYLDGCVLVLGVFTGSALWWLILSGSVGLLRGRIGSGWMRVVNRLSGFIIFAFGFSVMTIIFR